jgi:hypothetical protein
MKMNGSFPRLSWPLLTFARLGATAEYMLTHVPRSDSFAALPTLHVHDFDDWDDGEVMHVIDPVLPQMTWLQCLHPSHLAVGGFLVALASSSQVTLPHLTSFHIAGCDLAEAALRGPEGAKLMDLLRAFAATRIVAGQPTAQALHMW